MDKVIESLKQIRKHAAIKRAFSSYSLSICESLIANPYLIKKVCDEYGITTEELLIIITKEDISNLPLLDELMSSTARSNDREKQIGSTEDSNRMIKQYLN